VVLCDVDDIGKGNLICIRVVGGNDFDIWTLVELGDKIRE
jgi:hypothetical protein